MIMRGDFALHFGYDERENERMASERERDGEVI